MRDVVSDLLARIPGVVRLAGEPSVRGLVLESQGDVRPPGYVLAECAVDVGITVRAFGVIELRKRLVAVVVLCHEVDRRACAVEAVEERPGAGHHFDPVGVFGREIIKLEHAGCGVVQPPSVGCDRDGPPVNAVERGLTVLSLALLVHHKDSGVGLKYPPQVAVVQPVEVQVRPDFRSIREPVERPHQRWRAHPSQRVSHRTRIGPPVFQRVGRNMPDAEGVLGMGTGSCGICTGAGNEERRRHRRSRHWRLNDANQEKAQSDHRHPARRPPSDYFRSGSG